MCCHLGQKRNIYTVTVPKLFPSGCVINYKTCSLPTHSSPCRSLHLFLPLYFHFSVATLSLLQVNFPSLSLCLARSHLILPHFVFYVFLPFKFFSSIPRAALSSWSMAIPLPLLFISGFLSLSVCLFHSLEPSHLFVSFWTEDSLALL